MTVHASPAAFTAQPLSTTWQRPLALLVFAWGALLTIFHRDVADLAFIYWNSTTFGHCLFVLPVIAWLVWQRRGDLAQVMPAAWWPGLALVVAGAGGWFLGDIAGVAFARHLGLVLMLQGAVAAILGPNVTRAILFPLAYLVFLVPFGEFLEGPLQDVTTAMTMPLLHLFGVPATVDGVLITIPNGYFEVAEACSGAKFVIAMVAYGALVANVCYVSWGRRAAFVAMALVVPVIANGLRASGTIYAAHLTSVEAATGFDHIVYGWVFFGLVMAAVLAIGWRWFDRDPDAAWVDTTRLQTPPAPADRSAVTGAIIAIAVLAYAVGALLVARSDALPAQLELPDVPGWTRVEVSTRAPWAPWYPTADHVLNGRYADAQGHVVDLAVAVYAGQREGHELVGFGQGLLRENDRWVKVMDEPSIAGGRVERIVAPGPVEREVATWYRIAGTTTASERRVKIETLKAKLIGGPQRGVALHLSAEGGEGPAPRAAIAAFLAAAGPVDTLADRIAAGR
ncbi:exosortase A [Sphingomonas donggukensis]|uniref:Exosortase A n=1 Tax=Sphingomonas donggukensis TaxID=2949093 RepID=A0ABY4TWK8_9SPHN|nr:exosortase A [Sphingomonas donggukensis]URW76772.1 exosortase A [Sphingomonas donggukensis]